MPSLSFAWFIVAAIAFASSLTTTQLWAASSAEMHLSGLRYTLTDNGTGQASASALTLLPLSEHGGDGVTWQYAHVTRFDTPDWFNTQDRYTGALTPLVIPRNDVVQASLQGTSASVSMQVIATRATSTREASIRAQAPSRPTTASIRATGPGPWCCRPTRR